MAQLLAIEWDAREVRLVVGRTRGKDITIEQAFAVDLGDAQEQVAPEAIGERIKHELRQREIGRVETLVAVGRASIELKQLSLPPAPDDELPEMVRFQALRQFTTIGEDWPLDFVRLNAGDSESLNVLAAVIAPDVVQQIRKICVGAELVPKHFVLRPFAAASLLRRHDLGKAQPCRLMVDLLAEEVDLTVLDGDYLVLTRTVRLQFTETGAVQSRALLSEIRRTIAAANNQLVGRRVEQVTFCGDGEDHAEIKTLIEQELTLAVELFDPFAEFRQAGQLRLPEHSSRFAPLLGMLLDAASGVPHAIDFLHPRKRREKTDIRRRNRLIAATVGTLAFAALFLVWVSLNSMDEEIEQLRGESARLKREVAKADELRKDEAAVQAFLDRNISVLDELDAVAQRLPDAENVIVTELAYTLEPNGGKLKIDGFTREQTAFQDIERRLRAGKRTVSSNTKANDPKRDKHRYGFSEVVQIPPGEAAGEKQAKESDSSAKPAEKTAAADRGGSRNQ